MARRRSLNRRWSRRSLNGTGILNDDSNIYEEGDPLWWKQIENNPNSIRPSGRFSLGEVSTTTELNPDSAINDTSTTDKWWEVLQKTSQDLEPKKSHKNNSKTVPKNNISSHTSDSDTDDRSRKMKKQKLNFRRSQKSLSINAFSQILNSSEPAIESEPILSQNSRLNHISYQSLDELPLRKTRQQNVNNSTLSYHSNSSDSEKIRKKRPILFKKPRDKMSSIINHETSDRLALEKNLEYVLEEENDKHDESPEKLSITTLASQPSSRKTPEKFKRLSTPYSKVNYQNEEPTDDSDFDSEISRDQLVYELPNMNRSDSVTLSDSDIENEASKTENVLENHSSKNMQSLEINRSSEKRLSPLKTRDSIENKNDSSIQPSEPSLSTSGIRKKLFVHKSSVYPSGRKSSKPNISSNQRSILNFLTPQNSRPVRHEPLPTEDEVLNFNEKLKTVTIERDIQKKTQKITMEEELEEMRIKLANKTSRIKKIPKKIVLRKKPKNSQNDINKAFIVNGKVYKQPKLPRPKHWATDRLYKYLWKILEPKCKFETRVRSEKFVIDLSNVVAIVMRRKKYENYKDDVDALMMRMARLGIIKTRADFYDFCYDFLPYEFRAKVTPILQPGNKITIPYNPEIVDTPLINE